jgi:hypothetical protein
MSKYSELADRLVPRLPGGNITVPTVQTVVEASAALRELEAERDRLREALERIATAGGYDATDLENMARAALQEGK